MRVGRFSIYRGRNGQYYWRFKAPNGWVMADGAEGYTRRHDAERALDRFMAHLQKAASRTLAWHKKG